MYNYFEWLYKCPPNDSLCLSIVYGAVLIVVYVIFALLIGLIWDGFKYFSQSVIKSSAPQTTDFLCVNSLWRILKDRNKLKPNVRKEGFEVYIDVKNTKKSDILKLRITSDFPDGVNGFIREPLEWRKGSNKNGEVFIKKGKTETIHFATINQLERTFDVHFSNREDFNTPFENDKLLSLNVKGSTSESLDVDIHNTLLIQGNVKNGILIFGIMFEFGNKPSI